MTTVANARVLEMQADSAVLNSNTDGSAASGRPDAITTVTGAGGVVEDVVGKGELGGQPLYPPTPMIGHLTNEEIEALNDVFSRMELFEAEESARIRYVHVNLHSAPPRTKVTAICSTYITVALWNQVCSYFYCFFVSKSF